MHVFVHRTRSTAYLSEEWHVEQVDLAVLLQRSDYVILPDASDAQGLATMAVAEQVAGRDRLAEEKRATEYALIAKSRSFRWTHNAGIHCPC